MSTEPNDVLDSLGELIKRVSAGERESRDRANAARDRVSTLRAQLAGAESELAAAVRQSDADQLFLREIWEHYRSEVASEPRRPSTIADPTPDQGRRIAATTPQRLHLPG